MEAAISARFQPLLALARQFGRPNNNGGVNDDDPATAAFDERRWVDDVRSLLLERERELAHAFDRVAPCFPPDWRIFDHVFQCYHVQVAAAVDLIGRRARRLSTAAQLALLEWVGGYQSTLRGLGVEEGLVRLPVAPMLPPEPRRMRGGVGRAAATKKEEAEATAATNEEQQEEDDSNDDDEDADTRPGVALLIETYADRMEATVRGWVDKILESDLRSGPRPAGAAATLRTPGAVEFFRILNEQVGVLEDVSRGELLHHVARRSLSAMRAFVEAQRAVLPRAAAAPAGLELLCAFLNNNLDCYAQSIEFTDHVRALLAQGEQGAGGMGASTSLGRRLTAGSGITPSVSASALASSAAAATSAPQTATTLVPPLDVEDTCRAFLELAKTIGARVVDLIFSDEGMRDQTRRFFAPPTPAGGGGEWEGGAATATALATLGDYFGDVVAYVDPVFAPRVIEGCLQELVRSYVVAAAERLPASTDARLARMACDEREVRAFFAGPEGLAADAGRIGGGDLGRRRPSSAGRRRARQSGWSRGDDDEEETEEEEHDNGAAAPWQQQQRAGLAAAAAHPSSTARAWLPLAKVARHTAAIGALCGLYAAPAAGSLARAYASALDACPESGLTPVVLERMLAARGDLSRQAQADAAALCREAYSVWQRRERARGRANPLGAPAGAGAAGGGGGAGGGAGSKDERGGGGGSGLARFFFLNQKKKEEEKKHQQRPGGFLDG
jgi:hypothetical protein